MIASSLQLEYYYVDKLSFSTQDDFDESAVRRGSVYVPEPQDLHVALHSHKNAEDERRLAFRLEVTLLEKAQLPYYFETTLVGFFRVSDEVPEGEMNYLADVNAPAVLWGAVRELVFGLTGRGPYPPLCLPAVTFIDAVRIPIEDDASDENPQLPRVEVSKVLKES